MRVAVITILMAFLVSNVRAQADCDIATTGVAIVSTVPPNDPVSTICVGQHAYFKFSIANLGTSTGCAIPAGSVTAVFSLPISAGTPPYSYVGVITPATPYFNWVYNSMANVLIGTNTLPIPHGMGDANILVEVVGNVPGTASSGLNLTQNGVTSDNTANNTGSAQLIVAAIPVVSDQPNQSLCGTSTFTMTQSAPSPGSGLWTLTSGSATITTPTSPTTTITGVAPGASATVRWTVTNASCSAYDEVTVTNVTPPDLFADVTSPLSTTFTPSQAKDGYVTITNSASAGATTGQIVFWISKPSNFTMQLLSSTINVFPEEDNPNPVAVNNTQFTVTDMGIFYEVKSNIGVVINPGTFKRIGFKLTAINFPNFSGITTVTIINNTGGSVASCGDSNSSNNQSIILFSINP